jgi:hypothetical protein
MPNYPIKSRTQDKRRPPRFERLHDLAAFLLGYEPYHVFADLFYFKESLAPKSEHWLRDLPAHLGSFLDPYSIGRLGATIGEVIAQYEAHPNVRAPEKPKKGSAKNQAGKAATSVIPPVTDRDIFSLNSFFYGGDQPGHALIGLAQSASERLPEPMRQWFRFGQAVGQCLVRVAAKRGEPYFGPTTDLQEKNQDNAEEMDVNLDDDYGESEVVDVDPESVSKYEKDVNENARDVETDAEDVDDDLEFDLRTEIQVAASGTDWHSDDVPNLAFATFLESEHGRYDWWAYGMIEKLVLSVVRFLEDDAPIVLRPESLDLWFLGVRVKLTRKECDLLCAAVKCPTDSVSREYLLGIKPSSSGDAAPADALSRADQWLQQIIAKFAESLAKAKSVYFKDSVEATRGWLRDEFFVSVHGVGWQKGPLLAQMVISERS